MWSRRAVLAGLVASPVLAAACVSGAVRKAPPDGESQGGASDGPGPAGYRRLPVPPLAESRTENGVRWFDLEARPGIASIVPGKSTPTWGYSQDILGPTLRARTGETVGVQVRNGLPEATSVHWHGMHLPARFDGGPHQPIEPGAVWEPSWTVAQPAATLWYHPHPHGTTQLHTYRGLAGLFLVDDGTGADTGLPHEYGVDDLPVIVQDKKLNTDGTLDERDDAGTGLIGPTVTTNGITGAYVPVTTDRVRLRILNASTMRVYELGLDDNSEFEMVASDGGLLAAPVRLRRLALTPGERAEIVVAMQAGRPRTLRSFPAPLPARKGRGPSGGAALSEEFELLLLNPDAELRTAPATPSKLAAIPPPVTAAAVARTFALDGNTINGRPMDMNRIDATATVDVPEIWTVRNTHNRVHNFHVHDNHFQVLDVNGSPPPPELAGWKDTVSVPPSGSVRLAVVFRDYTDPQSPYMFHCHLMRHEDDGMMGQFLVVEPGHPAG
ncbi:multicopper oxidase family protein [Streptomyces sp. NRRL B-24484]|uniref:multicopper oxidase family protein n=1 Tax=Streptomyces sp. NRRL B-24484 TaxID=1463833 RepID=UPI0004BF24D6|nr:multicopper oxidase domain-containing protein [Streptomyces sp. NRRL B-24484]